MMKTHIFLLMVAISVVLGIITGCTADDSQNLTGQNLLESVPAFQSNVDTVLVEVDTLSDTLGKVTLINRTIFVTGNDSLTTFKDTIVLDTGVVNPVEFLGVDALQNGLDSVILTKDTTIGLDGIKVVQNKLTLLSDGDTIDSYKESYVLDSTTIEKQAFENVDTLVTQPADSTLNEGEVYIVNNYGRSVGVEVWSGSDLGYNDGIVFGHNVTKQMSLTTIEESGLQGAIVLSDQGYSDELIIFGLEIDHVYTYLSHTFASYLPTGAKIILSATGTINIVR